MGVSHTKKQQAFICESQYFQILPDTHQHQSHPQPWVRTRLISTSSSLVTSTPASRPRPATSSTNAVVLTSVPSRSSRRKLPSSARVPSSTLGSSTSSSRSASVVSRSTSLCGSLRRLSTMSPRPPRRPARNKQVRLPSLLEGNGCELASNGQLFFLHLHSIPQHLLFLALPRHAFAWSFGRCMGMMKKQAAPFPLL